MQLLHQTLYLSYSCDRLLLVMNSFMSSCSYRKVAVLSLSRPCWPRSCGTGSPWSRVRNCQLNLISLGIGSLRMVMSTYHWPVSLGRYIRRRDWLYYSQFPRERSACIKNLATMQTGCELGEIGHSGHMIRIESYKLHLETQLHRLEQNVSLHVLICPSIRRSFKTYNLGSQIIQNGTRPQLQHNNSNYFREPRPQ